MTYASSRAQEADIWVVAPAGGAYAEVVAALRAELEQWRPQGLAPRVVNPDDVGSAGGQPRLMVSVGSAAFQAALARRARVGAGGTALLATLLPRGSFERELAQRGAADEDRRRVSAVVLDQPYERQADLIRAALPAARRVGLLVGAESGAAVPALQQAFGAAGLGLDVEDVRQRGAIGALQALLEDNDVLLALPDPGVFNGESLAGILAAGYRRQVPLVAFSPAYVKAGALAAVYATPAQVGRAAADAVRRWFAGGMLPPVAPPREFSIEVNPAVARSLGLSIDADALRARLGAERRP